MAKTIISLKIFVQHTCTSELLLFKDALNTLLSIAVSILVMRIFFYPRLPVHVEGTVSIIFNSVTKRQHYIPSFVLLNSCSYIANFLG